MDKLIFWICTQWKSYVHVYSTYRLNNFGNMENYENVHHFLENLSVVAGESRSNT